LPIAKSLPSLVSLLRLALAPWVAIYILTGRYAAAMVLFVIAAFTDIIDGYLARRFNLQTKIGAILDPLTDKALVVTIYVSLAVTKDLPFWLVAMVFGRDFLILLMAGFAMAFTKLRDFPPSRWGKYSTFSQIVTAVTAMVHAGRLLENIGWILEGFMLACAFMTAVSGLHYLATGIARLRRATPESAG